MKITFVAPAHDDTDETHIEGEAELVDGQLRVDAEVVEYTEANPALPGRVNLQKLAGEDAELWLRGIATMTGGFGLVPIPSEDLSTDELTEEEVARLRSLVGGGEAPAEEAEPVEKRAPTVPNRLTRP
jgi:hypothetical protein